MKMKPLFKLDGVTKTSVNLENYDFSEQNLRSRARLLHVAIKNSEDEDERYFIYTVSKINKMTRWIHLTQKCERCIYFHFTMTRREVSKID